METSRKSFTNAFKQCKTKLGPKNQLNATKKEL